jgi:hypothetical protein
MYVYGEIQLGKLKGKALSPSISIEIARIKDNDANPYASNTDT